MTLESQWTNKRDDEIQRAINELGTYTPEAQEIILAESRRRRLDPQAASPESRPDDDETPRTMTKLGKGIMVAALIFGSVLAVIIEPSLAAYLGKALIPTLFTLIIISRRMTEEGLLLRVTGMCFGFALLEAYGATRDIDPLTVLRDGTITSVIAYVILRLSFDKRIFSRAALQAEQVNRIERLKELTPIQVAQSHRQEVNTEMSVGQDDNVTPQPKEPPVRQISGTRTGKPNYAIIYGLGLLTVVALAIAYYFAVALPAQNAQRLRLERDQFEATQQREKQEEQAKQEAAQEAKEQTQQAKAEAQAEEQRRAQIRADCDQEAEAAYWKHIKLNTTEVEPGKYQGPHRVFDEAEKIKKDTLDFCYKRNGLR